MINKIFLGGTCANTTWRTFIEDNISISSFNPVVDDWTPDCQAIEQDEKDNKCNIHLYVITKEMKGVFSIAEIMDSVHTSNKTTIVQILPNGFNEAQLKSLKAVVNLVKLRGGIAYIDDDLTRTCNILNLCFK